jgi:anti-anti-sigma factor
LDDGAANGATVGPDEVRIVTEIDGSVLWLRLAGEVDAATAPALESALAGGAAGGHDEVVLDCRGLEFIDSSGLNVLVTAHKRLGEAGTRLVIASPPPAARRLFGISGVDRVLTIRE